MMFFRVKLENAMPSFCVNTHLPVSQVTAIDVIDHEFLTRVSLESPSCPPSGVGVPNDVTHACVFLASQICDAILCTASYNNSLATCLDDIPQTATQMIINYPSKLNKLVTCHPCIPSWTPTNL